MGNGTVFVTAISFALEKEVTTEVDVNAVSAWKAAVPVGSQEEVVQLDNSFTACLGGRLAGPRVLEVFLPPRSLGPYLLYPRATSSMDFRVCVGYAVEVEEGVDSPEFVSLVDPVEADRVSVFVTVVTVALVDSVEVDRVSVFVTVITVALLYSMEVVVTTSGAAEGVMVLVTVVEAAGICTEEPTMIVSGTGVIVV